MQSETGRVARFFEGYATDFDFIYDTGDKSPVRRFIDRKLRVSMRRRFEETARLISEVEAKTVLDVGCGPGRQAVWLAKHLGYAVHGIDLAPAMIELATQAARDTDANVAFTVGDFMLAPLREDRYDAVFSLGVVEYVRDAEAFVGRMMQASRRLVAFSVPVRWHWLTPQRRFRYRLRNCPLYFYDEASISRLLRSLGAEQFEILKLARDYVVGIYL
jgi:SAM-dependent methyltransferase